LTPSTTAEVGASTYLPQLSNGTPGATTHVYVSQTGKIDPAHVGDASGKYVVIEVNTDYRTMYGTDWRARLVGGVKQVAAISGASVTVLASDTEIGNSEPIAVAGGSGGGGGGGGGGWGGGGGTGTATYTITQKVIDDDLFTLEDLAGYEIYTNTNEGITEQTVTIDGEEKVFKVPPTTWASKVKGGAFHATHCFSETDGEYHDVDLMYSLFVPKDYDEQVAAGKKFALALHFEDAGIKGSDPMLALAEVSVAANYASDRVQQIVKNQGLGGLIVVLPQVPSAAANTVSDNVTGTEYIPAVWQLLDDLTGNEARSVKARYEIDMGRIYGSGQSMGGMSVLNMASQRDNYFAGIWSIGSNWGSNYDKELVKYAGRGQEAKTYFTYPYDGKIITNPYWENWYWSVSDDNILATNMVSDTRATEYWTLLKNLYLDLAGVDVPRVQWDPILTPVADQSSKLQVLTSLPNATGIYWNALSNGDHMGTWIFAHAITSSYDWLLTRTKVVPVGTSDNLTTTKRNKLDILAEPYPKGTLCYNSQTVDIKLEKFSISEDCQKLLQ
jgi:hypothetical protein